MNYGRFGKDGRKMVHPVGDHTGNPMPVRGYAAKRIIDLFRFNGSSCHSGRGSMVWIIEEFCKTNDIQLTVTQHAKGYVCTKSAPSDQKPVENQ